MLDPVLEIQHQLSPDKDDFFLTSAASKISNYYRPITLRLLQKNCRLLNLKCDDLLQRAWQKETDQECYKALQTYHARQHYLTERSLHAYLLASLRNYTKQRFWSQSGKKKYCALICPACRVNGEKNLLTSEKTLWRCSVCTEKKASVSFSLQSFYSSFALHSRSGYLCPECYNFIPRSLVKNNQVTCPFPSCCFSGPILTLNRTTHPVTIRFHDTISFDMGNDKQPIFIDHNSSLSEAHVLLQDSSKKELNLLREVIFSAMDFTERQNLPATKLQKTLFYRAFWDLTQESPEEMIAYLVHNKTSFDFPLQSRIFQKFLFHLENFLPYSCVIGNGQKKEIVSLFDEHLSLFDGESSFCGIVQKDHSVPNLTSEHYLSDNLKDYGSYFLGKIVELKDANGLDLLPEMENNSFVKIQLSQNVSPGTKIFVRHYRLIPHYTMGILIYLQKIRKHLGEVLARKKKNWR